MDRYLWTHEIANSHLVGQSPLLSLLQVGQKKPMLVQSKLLAPDDPEVIIVELFLVWTDQILRCETWVH